MFFSRQFSSLRFILPGGMPGPGGERKCDTPSAGMSQYSDDVDMDAGTADHPGNKKFSQESDVESVVSGFSDACSFFG